MKNKFSSDGCSDFVDEIVEVKWDMIDTVYYLRKEELLILVQSINVDNWELCS